MGRVRYVCHFILWFMERNTICSEEVDSTKDLRTRKSVKPLLSMSQGPRMYPIHADKPSPRYRVGVGTHSCIMSYEFPRFRDITEYSTNAMIIPTKVIPPPCAQGIMSYCDIRRLRRLAVLGDKGTKSKL